MKFKDLIEKYLPAENIKFIFKSMTILGLLLYPLGFIGKQYYYFVFVDFSLFFILGTAYGYYSKIVGEYLNAHYPEIYHKYKPTLEPVFKWQKTGIFIHPEIILDLPAIRSRLDEKALKLLDAYKLAMTYGEYSFFIILLKDIIWVLF